MKRKELKQQIKELQKELNSIKQSEAYRFFLQFKNPIVAGEQNGFVQIVAEKSDIVSDYVVVSKEMLEPFTFTN